MDIRHLLESVTLADVRTIQRDGSLKLDPEAGLAGLPVDVEDGSVSIELNPAAWDERIEVWFRVVLSRQDVQIACAVAVVYTRPSNETIPDDVRVEFLEKVAVMTAFPYLRAEVQAAAAALRVGDITLDVLRQGQFQVATHEQGGSIRG